MQRVIGAVLIITATSGAGYLYGADLKRYLDKMLYLRYIVGLIRGGRWSIQGRPSQRSSVRSEEE